jgi:hypothetical protein
MSRATKAVAALLGLGREDGESARAAAAGVAFGKMLLANSPTEAERSAAVAALLQKSAENVSLHNRIAAAYAEAMMKRRERPGDRDHEQERAHRPKRI